jgi:hypothetical protein
MPPSIALNPVASPLDLPTTEIEPIRKIRVAATTRPKLQILLPLYSYPNWYHPDRYLWTQVAAAADRVEITAIINPNNGPGGMPNSDYQQGIADLQQGGVKLVGYIHTSYGNRNLAAIERDLDTYGKYFDLDGIFVDEVTTNRHQINYNHHIDRYIKSHLKLKQTILNPGTTIDENYLAQAIGDTIVLFENDLLAWEKYQPPAYITKYPRSKFAALIHTNSDINSMFASIDRAIARGFGQIYVTDGHNRPPASNPWNTLPSYWQEQVNYLSK